MEIKDVECFSSRFFFLRSRLHELENVSKTMGWVEEGGRWHSKRQRCRQEFEVTRASWT